MKKLTLIISYLAAFSSSSYSQIESINSQSQSPSDKKILWQKTQVEDLPILGKKTLLVFKNAQYDFSTNLFPFYSERIAMPFGAYSADVKITEPVFEPLSEEEKNAVNGYSPQNKFSLTDEIKISTTVSYLKKKPVAYVQFIPIRKNKTTGVYEKLISFSLMTTPFIDVERKTYSSNKIYSSNSVL